MKKLYLLLALTMIGINLPMQAMERKRPAAAAPTGTPNRPIKKAAVAPSPYGFDHPTPNYCRKVITFLSQNEPDRALAEITTCYRKIPQNFMRTNWIIPGEVEAIKEATRKQFYKKTNIAIFYSIFLSILQSNTDANIATIDTRNLTIEKHPKHDAFRIQLRLSDFTIIYTIDENNEQHVEITPKEITNPRTVGKYNPGNFVKQTILDLLNINVTTEDQHDVLATNLTQILQKIPFQYHENKERFYHTVIFSIFMFMGSNFSLAEAYTGNGRADLVYRSKIGNGIIEFKLNSRDEEEALSQIVEKRYIHCFDPGKIKFLGINVHTNIVPDEYVHLESIDIIPRIFNYQSPRIQQTASGHSVKL